MNKKYYLLLTAGVLFYAGVAHAEMLTGTITNIDMSGQNITVRRADTNANVTVHVKDKNALSSLATGSQVNIDANKKLWGKWETQSVIPSSSDASQANSGASAANANTGAGSTSDMNSNQNSTSGAYSASDNPNSNSSNSGSNSSASDSASKNSGTSNNY